MNVSISRFTALVSISAFLFQSCGGIKPSAPSTANQTIEKKALPAISSTINIPIKVEMKPFLKMADDAFDKEFTGSDKPCSGLRYDYKVQRQPLKVTGKGKTLFLDLNMAYGFRGEYCAGCIMETCVNPPIPFSCGWNESLRRVNVKLSSDIEILSNYRIKSTSKFQELNTIDPCAVTFANININNVLLSQLKPQLGTFAKMIDQEVAKQDLKPYILPVWKALQEDIKIDQVGYLRFQPQQLSLGELSMNGTQLTFSIGLKAAPVITPESQTKPSSALPNLSPYQKNESFALGKEKIQVTYMKLFPANEKLGVEVGFTGTKKGVFYLLGNPEFDSKSGHLKLKNVEYDIATKNVLIKSAKWLLDETIRKKLEEQMDFDMSDVVNSTKKSINESLNQKMDFGVQLKGALTALDIVGWDINSKNLVVRAKTKGDLQVIVNQ